MIRILLATDNHIGYLERDPIRGQDSINTFKEVLQLAVKHDVSSALLWRAAFSARHGCGTIQLGTSMTVVVVVVDMPELGRLCSPCWRLVP